MNIAILKPDYKIRGGFEIVLEKIVEFLISKGNNVKYVFVDMTIRRYNLYGVEVTENQYNYNSEFLNYINATENFLNLELSEFDLVISTQPPSYVVNHHNVACLFYHHHKLFYDLGPENVECLNTDKDVFNASREIIQNIDNKYLKQATIIFAGSKHVANRLEKYNNINSKYIEVFYAGIDDKKFYYDGPTSFGKPICVGRHEFPKRPELFIHAMKYINDIEGIIVGHGGKTNDLKKLDSYLSYAKHNGIEINDRELWRDIALNNNYNEVSHDFDSNVIFLGRISDEELIEQYANSLCVVCPAYEEDYGLTAIEAMCFGKPCIATKDGGGYIELIDDGITGFIVDPTGEAIAEKIKFLRDNPSVLEEMSNNAYKKSRAFSWNLLLEDFYNKLMKGVS